MSTRRSITKKPEVENMNIVCFKENREAQVRSSPSPLDHFNEAPKSPTQLQHLTSGPGIDHVHMACVTVLCQPEDLNVPLPSILRDMIMFA